MKSLKHIAKKERIIILVIGLVVGAILGGTFHKETIVVREGTADTPAALTSVNLMIDNGRGSVRTWNTVSWHEAMSILDLLQFVADSKNITLEKTPTGVLSIDGLRNATSTGERWQYWVNNTYEPKVPNKYYLKPGDIVLWKFVSPQGI